VLIAAREKDSGVSFLWYGEPDAEGDSIIDLTELEPEQTQS